MGRNGASAAAQALAGKAFTKAKFDWQDAIRRDSDLTRFDCCVAQELSSFFNRHTGEAYPSHQTIAGKLNASRSGVKKSLLRLAHAGYLEVTEGRGRTHTNRYRMRLKKGPVWDPFRGWSNAQRVPDRTKKGPAQAQKRSPAGPQNPVTNSLKNPSVDAPAGSLATALPTGALPRPPCGKQAEPKRAAQGKNGSGAPLARTQLNPHAEQQQFDRELTEIIGEQYWLLPEDQRAKLHDDWSKGKLSADDVRAKFSSSSPAPTVMPTAGIAEQTKRPEP
jgi:hypothetical protein